jgi:hypothetical protein
MCQESTANDPPACLVNYNVKYRSSVEAVKKWGDEANIPVRVFEKFDGGGFNYYICEFDTFAAAERFQQDFKLKGDPVWGEDADGKIHYLPSEKSAKPSEAKPAIVSLARDGFVPVRLDQLDLSTAEQEVLVAGARLLTSSGEQADETPTTSDDTPTDGNIRQEIASLTLAYADREAAWLNRYNKGDKEVEWAFKEGFYKKRFQELLILLPDEAVERLHLIISQKMSNLPGESTRNRSAEDTLKLIKRLSHAIEDKDTQPKP